MRPLHAKRPSRCPGGEDYDAPYSAAAAVATTAAGAAAAAAEAAAAGVGHRPA